MTNPSVSWLYLLAYLHFTGADQATAEAALAALQKAGVVNATGIVDLDATADAVKAALGSTVVEQLGDKLDAVAAAVLLGRYSNMYKLLRENLTPDTYVQIVRNKILVDIQGGDILYQIFTCNVLLAKVRLYKSCFNSWFMFALFMCV
jgi:hypothetical protein